MSTETWRTVGNVFGLAWTLVTDGAVALDQGVRERAVGNLEEALPLMRRTGICFGLAEALSTRGRLATSQGDHDGAAAYYAEALELYTCFGNSHAIRQCQQAMTALGDP